ncbi:MAG TPA: vitamin K epoxide reductase family protein [Solirubrobacterales bacterium]|nr:vitamin K epoxide reductase family protein [Solirubrobacterales bacterium]
MSRLGADRATTVATVLTLAGIAIAGYLTYVHYEGLSPVCTTGGCERVQASSYSEIGPIPVALLGLLGYVAILASLAVRGDFARAATFMLALIGFAFSLYLTYLELFVIDAICQWCVASAVVMAALLVVATIRLLRPEAPGRAAPG